ncbi:hypothetical protein LWI28_008835 [Acer negundo]|uniref:Uncharacterized protein n=1 Tax=Acer negundo TaxID=4023 RepID=A0AAD5P1E8_ACENE|nr:hypothetical protein LWI28_008835 [Acer negundo]
MSIPKLTILLITLLFLQICSGGVSSLKTSEIDVMVNNVEDCLSDPEMESETSRRVLVMGKRQTLTTEAVKSSQDVLETPKIDTHMKIHLFCNWEEFFYRRI